MLALRSLLALSLLLIAGLPYAHAPAAQAAIPVSLVQNGSFEEGVYAPGERPPGWGHQGFSDAASFSWDSSQALIGQRSVAIVHLSQNDAAWVTTVPVQPHTLYALSGWIKTVDVALGAGANLALMGTWTHSEGLFGTRDWTYTSLRFRTGDETELTIGARLGYWSGTSTGTAWFDGVRLTPLSPSSPTPAWKILVLIYGTTDVSYVEPSGAARHVIARMSAAERDRAAREATAFVTQDIPALTGGAMVPSLTIRYPPDPLGRLSDYGGGWWPAPVDTGPDLDPSFDSVIVIWEQHGVDQNSGAALDLNGYAGLTPSMGSGQTYATLIAGATRYGHRNVLKHEWGHSILFYFEASGLAPLPTVTNHASPGQYVHCPSGASYVWADETDANLIPNSIYHNSSGFTHDYYSGTVATPDQPTRCLGITPAAWALGGPVSNSAYYPYYHQLELSPASAGQTGAPGEAVAHRLTLVNSGNLTDTFRVEVAGAAWGGEAPPSVGPVGPGQPAELEVLVRIPTGPAATHTTRLRCWSARRATPPRCARPASAA